MKAKSAVHLAALAAAIVLSAIRGYAQDVLIVVNGNCAISTISKAQLRDIFLGTSARFSDGSHAVPVLLKGGPAHEVFLQHHIGERPDDFRARWRKAVFTGQGAMPREFNSEESALSYIEATPGAIGYVSRPPTARAVKLLTVNGGS